jgi:hypothetical protein
MKKEMLLEDKIIYEIKKENIQLTLKEEVLSLCKNLTILERRMLDRGYSRKDVNAACRKLINESDAKFHKRLINENFFSSLTTGALSHLIPGVSDYFKRRLIIYICKKLGISLDSPFKRYLANVVKNIKFTELFGYFKEGKCPLIVETLIGASLDSLVEFVLSEISKAGIGSEPEQTDPDEGYLEKLGDKMIESGLPPEVLQFFADTDSLGSGVLIQVIEDHIKRYLAPPLIRTVSGIICEDLSFEKTAAAVEDSFKSTTKKDSEKRAAKEASEKEIKDAKKKKSKKYDDIMRKYNLQ